ncbi:MAG: MFS transporter [Proteobacteria bacterium]|nr:MFS transporter [Pseudomonadota bacterium]
METTVSGNRTLVVRTCLVYLTIFAWSGLNQPYLPSLLAERGLSEAQIAMVVGAPMFARLFVTPLVGRVADRVGDTRRMIQALAFVGVALALILWQVSGFVAILVFYVAMMMALQNVPPVFDAGAVDLVRRGIVRNFGRLRVFGSAGFAVTSLIGGVLLGWGGSAAVYAAFVVSVCAMGCASFLLPKTDRSHVARDAGPESGAFRRPAVLAMMAAAALVMGSHAMWNSFSVIHLRELGTPETMIGMMWSIATISEMAMFWMGPFVARFLGPVGTLALAAGGAALRWGLMALDPGPWPTLLLQTMHAVSFSCTHLGLQAFIAVTISSARGASAQATYVTISGTTLGVVTLASGPLYHAYGGGAYLFAAALGIVSLAVLFVFRHRIADELAKGRRHDAA